MSFLKPVSKKGHGRKNRLADVPSENYSNFWKFNRLRLCQFRKQFFFSLTKLILIYTKAIFNWPNKYIWQTFKCFKSARDAT